MKLNILPSYKLLLYLNISNNTISSIPPSFFKSQSELVILDLSDNNINVLTKTIFSTLHMLRQLYVYGNLLKDIDISVFSDLQVLQVLQTDRDDLCCLVDERKVKCRQSKTPSFSSCKDLLNLYMRICVWAFFVFIVLFNLTSFFYHLEKARKGRMSSRFLAMLSFNDCSFAIYLFTIGYIDVSSRNRYYLVKPFWISGVTCRNRYYLMKPFWISGVTCRNRYYLILLDETILDIWCDLQVNEIYSIIFNNGYGISCFQTCYHG